MHTLESLLPAYPFQQGLKPEHLHLMAGCASNVVFKPGEMIVREGEVADRFYGIRHGKALIEVFVPGRGAVQIQTIDEGEMVGFSWLVPPHIIRYDVRALVLTRATSFDAECLRRKCEEDTTLGYELMKRVCETMAQRLEATRLQIVDIYGHRS